MLTSPAPPREQSKSRFPSRDHPGTVASLRFPELLYWRPAMRRTHVSRALHPCADTLMNSLPGSAAIQSHSPQLSGNIISNYCLKSRRNGSFGRPRAQISAPGFQPPQQATLTQSRSYIPSPTKHDIAPWYRRRLPTKNPAGGGVFHEPSVLL